MSRLTKLLGTSKEYTIAGEKFIFKPLTMEHMDIILALEREDTRTDAMKKLIKTTLKQAVPDATDDELDHIGLQCFKELSEAIIDVNGLNA